jgi:hypothetical protein
VVASICLALTASLFALGGLAGMLYVLVSDRFHPARLIPVAVLVVMLAALGRLIHHLVQSFEAIRHAPPQARGFEPIMVPPAAASAVYQQDDARHDPPPPAHG